MKTFSEAEFEALKMAKKAILMSQIPDKNDVDVVFRTVVPGMKVFKKLEKAGLLFFTEEDPLVGGDLDGFCFTPIVELTEEGEATLKEIEND